MSDHVYITNKNITMDDQVNDVHLTSIRDIKIS